MHPSSWQPSATIASLRLRAHMIACIRDFFTNRHYLEVETPYMAHHGITDVYLANITARFREKTYYLQTSPEYHMKRLLAAGSGPIFQLARVFRDDELGRWHNPEFTLLEWYKLDVNHLTLLEEVDALLHMILGTAPLIKKTYQQAFLEICNVDPLNASLKELQHCVAQHGLSAVLPTDEIDKDQYLFLLMSHIVEPAFTDSPVPIAVIDFPVSQASLARIENNVASRFEVYYRGVELANGFHELTDAKAQCLRFEQDNRARRAKNLPENVADAYLLQALQYGLPECSGVALGIDRLLTLALQAPAIAALISFDFSIA